MTKKHLFYEVRSSCVGFNSLIFIKDISQDVPEEWGPFGLKSASRMFIYLVRMSIFLSD